MTSPKAKAVTWENTIIRTICITTGRKSEISDFFRINGSFGTIVAIDNHAPRRMRASSVIKPFCWFHGGSAAGKADSSIYEAIASEYRLIHGGLR